MGSSRIENETTGIWLVDKIGGKVKLEVERIKGKGEGNYKWLALKEIGLGLKDEFGNERSGVILEMVGGFENEDPRREKYANFIRKFIKEEKSSLSVSRIAKLIVQQPEFKNIRDRKIRDLLPVLFSNPYEFDGDQKLSLVKVRAKRREFSLVDSI